MLIDFNPKINTRAGGTFFYEITFAAGPEVIADSGDASYGTLYGREWMMVWDRDSDELVLYQEDPGGGWVPRTPDDPLPVINSDARRFSFVFDRVGRPIIAWEESGQIYVKQFDVVANDYLIRGPFSGKNPAMYNDAEARERVEDSDIYMIYQDVAPSPRIYYRKDVDSYSVENLHHTEGQDLVLDKAAPLYLQYELLVSDANGLPILVGGIKQALISDPYAFITPDEFSGDVLPLSGVYQLTLQIYQEQDEVLGQLFPLSSDYVETTTIYPEQDEVLGDLFPLSSDYVQTTVLYPEAEEASGDVFPLEARYERYIVRIEQPTPEVDGSIVILGGEYRAT